MNTDALSLPDLTAREVDDLLDPTAARFPRGADPLAFLGES